MADYVSSAEDIKSFMDSSMWRDMEKEIELWIEKIRDSSESPKLHEDDKSDDSLRGSAEALRDVLALPEVMIDNMMEDRDDRKRD